ncbi:MULTISPECIES: hypothetical protein [Aliivibrio]|uniref:hypothetical protein n=1 Tax=Aliivibrio TaxID=511678 RepID=UPI00080DF4F1|nr:MULTISPECIES: hypothetical protein [Aliivibrio]MBD1567939.1 hypothetical protein [Aliivibrio sp. S10_S31]OCH43696.1 hypothetical protein A6E02_11400 [Aliivibrio fischeri]OED52876.1 hypothetical protein BEI47_18640 [Aliivibrio fischeri]
MKTPTELFPKAEKLIVELVQYAGCTSAKELSNVLELLMSTSARGIERYAGNEHALLVCQRTTAHIELNPVINKVH